MRKYAFDGVVMELAVPQFFETFFSRLSDELHFLPGEKRIVVVIPPYLPGYPSAEVHPSPIICLTLKTLFSPNIHIDYFCLMTYDHNSNSHGGAPNAPIEWIEEQYLRFPG